MTFDTEPASSTMLYCKKIPPGGAGAQARGGMTSFVDMQAAYRDLPLTGA